MKEEARHMWDMRGRLHTRGVEVGPEWVAADLDVALELALEAAEHDFALPWLEAVHDGGDGAHVVRQGEEYELLVHKVGVVQAGLAVVQKGAGLRTHEDKGQAAPLLRV